MEVFRDRPCGGRRFLDLRDDGRPLGRKRLAETAPQRPLLAFEGFLLDQRPLGHELGPLAHDDLIQNGKLRNPCGRHHMYIPPLTLSTCPLM